MDLQTLQSKSNFCDPRWEPICRNKWHPGTEGTQKSVMERAQTRFGLVKTCWWRDAQKTMSTLSSSHQHLDNAFLPSSVLFLNVHWWNIVLAKKTTKTKTMYLPQMLLQIHAILVPVTPLNKLCRGDLSVIIVLLICHCLKKYRDGIMKYYFGEFLWRKLLIEKEMW